MAYINEYHCRSCENVWYSRQWPATRWEPACEDEPTCPKCGGHHDECDCPDCVLGARAAEEEEEEDATSDVCTEC